jgi:hypothetical protein
MKSPFDSYADDNSGEFAKNVIMAIGFFLSIAVAWWIVINYSDPE